MSKNLVRNTLGASAYWTVNKALARETSVYAALVLAQLISKHEYLEQREMTLVIDERECFYATADHLQEACCIGKKALTSALKLLDKKGLIQTCIAGMPAKKHFWINYDAVIEIAQTGCEGGKQAIPKGGKQGKSKWGKQGSAKGGEQYIENKERNHIKKSEEGRSASIDADPTPPVSEIEPTTVEAKPNTPPPVAAAPPVKAAKRKRSTATPCPLEEELAGYVRELLNEQQYRANVNGPQYWARHLAGTMRDYYEGEGKKMKNWRATARNWARRELSRGRLKFPAPNAPDFLDFRKPQLASETPKTLNRAIKAPTKNEDQALPAAHRLTSRFKI